MSPARASSRKPRHPRDPLGAVRAITRRLPGTEESTSYGTSAFRVGGKLFARLHQDGKSLVVRADFDQREALLAAHPGSFFLTDHYRNDPWVLIRLGEISRPALADALEQAWRQRAPRRLVERFEATS